MSIKTKTQKVAAVGIVLTLALSGSVMLAGCDMKKAASDNPIAKAISTSKKTAKEDYDNFGTVQNIDGIEFATVAYFEQNDVNEFNVDVMKQMLSENEIDWYQLIASSSMGTNTKQYGYLYFPAKVAFGDIEKCIQKLSSKFNGKMLTLDEYNAYVNKQKNSGSIDLYHNELTYYGPAAQK